jgi:hypothetical protein
MRCRKPIAVLLIAAFVDLTTSCTSLRRRSVDELVPGGHKYRIGRILKTSGERIEIGKLAHAWIVGNSILVGGQLEVPAAGTKVVKRDGGYAITPANGLTYETDDFALSEERYAFTTRSDILMPLSEVAALWDQEPNKVMTILAVAAGVVVASYIVLIILVATGTINLVTFSWKR